MKKILLLLLLNSGLLQAQIVNIPDANFKAKLLTASLTNYIAVNNLNQSAKIDLNNDGEIQYSEALNIVSLSIGNSNISNLTGIEAFQNIKRLYCEDNPIITLDLSSLVNLEIINCQNTQLVDLNIQNLVNLTGLACDMNNLASLDLTISHNWEYLSCTNNQITHLDFSTFTMYDSSGSEIWINNNQLTSLILKNGLIDDGYFQFENNPTLEFICADESEIAYFQNRVNNYGYTNCVVNSYCSFNPGGDYNTIIGNLPFDLDGNGCDASDVSYPFIKVGINDGTETSSAFTSNIGFYKFFTQAGTFTVTPQIENPTLFTITPANAVVTFPIVDNSVEVENFCITPNGIHPDIEITIAPIVPARPGFPAVYEVVYKNIGNQTLNQQYGISFFYNQNLMAFATSNPAPETQNAGALNWSVTNLQPFESRSIYVTMNVNAPTATNPVNINDVLTLTANAIPAVGETNTQNNTFQFNQTVVGSYDPNDKQCVEGDIVSPVKIGDYLHYLIRFENTGNFYAENIVVKDVIDASKFDVSSLQIMSSSHPVEAKVKGNIAEFIFQDIYLDSGGHGNILLKLKTIATLPVGTTVSNKADIFFDYNHPIVTNMANTTFEALSIPEKEQDHSVSVYPNPTYDIVKIKADSMIRSIQVFDIQGRILMTKLLSEENTSVDLSNYGAGIYYLKINTENGSKAEKLVKK